MVDVTQEYIDSMSSSIRNQSSVEVSVIIDDKETQSNSTVTCSTATDWAVSSALLNKSSFTISQAATLEQDCVRVGSFYDIPDANSTYDGYTSKALVTSSKWVKITFPKVTKIPGMIIDFGSLAPLPTKLTLYTISSTGTATLFKTYTKENISRQIVVEDVFEGKGIRIQCNAMQNKNQRFRLKSVQFTKTDVFTNDDIISLNLKNQITLNNEDFPQVDATITIYNENNKFDIENPDSDINFLTQENDVIINYSYKVDDKTTTKFTIATLKCSEWEASSTEFKLTACDKFRNNETAMFFQWWNLDIYYTANARKNNVSTLAGIACSVLNTKLTATYNNDYSVYERFEKDVTAKEALQMLSNIEGQVLTIQRDGTLKLIDTSGLETNRKLTYDDMLSEPDVAKTENVKDITISYLERSSEHEETTLTNDTITFEKGELYTVESNNPIISPTIYMNGDATPYARRMFTTDIELYKVNLTATQECTKTLKIVAETYKDNTEKTYKLTVGEDGTSITWENNNITTNEIAKAVAKRLSDYYQPTIEYDLDTRGFPELEPGDVIYQENRYNENMKVIITSTELTFDGGISETIHTRRLN